MNVAETGLGHKQVLWCWGGEIRCFSQVHRRQYPKDSRFWSGEADSAKSGYPLPLLVWLIMGVPVNLEVLTPVIYRKEAALSQWCHSIHTLLPRVSIFTADRQKSLWYGSFVVSFNLSDLERDFSTAYCKTGRHVGMLIWQWQYLQFIQHFLWGI